MIGSIGQCNDLMRPGWLPKDGIPLDVGWFLYNLVKFFTTPRAA
jgi:hypothetical protein